MSDWYQTKPVRKQARQWLCDGHCPFWAQHGVTEHNTYFEIATLEGVFRGEVGDWIILGLAGELYSCKPDIFAATYEPVT